MEFNTRVENTMRSFNARYGFRAPETLVYPEDDDLDDFRKYARMHDWYPLLDPTIEQLNTILTIVKDKYPQLLNITFITLLDDLYKEERRNPEQLISKEVVKFFRDLDFGTQIQFKAEHFPTISCSAENCSEDNTCIDCKESEEFVIKNMC